MFEATAVLLFTARYDASHISSQLSDCVGEHRPDRAGIGRRGRSGAGGSSDFKAAGRKSGRCDTGGPVFLLLPC